MNPSLFNRARAICAFILVAVLAGCTSPQTSNNTSAKSDTPAVSPAPAAAAPTAAAPAAAPAPTAALLPTIRIKAGVDEVFKDSKGTSWSADTGFDGGEGVDRSDLQVTGTDRPELYRAERYSMNSYSVKVPNGDYTLKLHFSEDYDGLTDPSMRVFTYEVKDGDAATGKSIKKVKDFSPWKASGAQFKAYVDTVPVAVSSGQISITFTPQVENPQINAIEVVPR